MMDFNSLKRTLLDNIDNLKYHSKQKQQKILEYNKKLKEEFPIKGEHCESIEKELIKKSELPLINEEEARKYAYKILKNKTLGSVDGSQLSPGKFVNLPITIIQTAYFLNKHDRSYKKETFTEAHILKEEEQPTNSKIDLLRFKKETETFMKIIEPERYLFFDGSLIVSFATQFSDEIRKEYVNSVNELLRKAKEKGSTVFGYVDTSYAKEIVNQLGGEGIQDSLLFDLKFGERSALFVSHRDVTKDYEEKVGFFYGRVNSKRIVRVELPEYCFGEIDKIWEVVLAQCIINRGYPYVLQRSHEEAVITEKDKQRFYKILENLTQYENIGIEFSNKTLSKIKTPTTPKKGGYV